MAKETTNAKQTATKKKNSHGRGTIRERKDGKGWEARYTVGTDPITGKQIRRSIYGKSQREVSRKLTAATNDINEGTHVDPLKMTVGEWLDIWANEYLVDVKYKTRQSYVENIRLHIKPHIGKIQLQKLDGLMVQQFCNRLSESGRLMQKGQTTEKPPGLSPKSVKNIFGILRAALNQAVLLGYIKANPATSGKKGKVKLPTGEKKTMSVLQDDDVARFLKACEDHDHGILFEVTLFTGARKGEVLGISWANVDFENRSIFLEKQVQRQKKDGEPSKLVLVPLKGAKPEDDKTRYIYPPDMVFQWLEEQKAKQDGMREDAGDFWEDTGLAFTGYTGKPLDPDAVYLNYKRFLKRNGLPSLRYHDLRHSNATLMIQNGVDIKTVQENLGHATADFTLKIYSHVTQKMKSEAAAKMEDYIKTVSS